MADNEQAPSKKASHVPPYEFEHQIVAVRVQCISACDEEEIPNHVVQRACGRNLEQCREKACIFSAILQGWHHKPHGRTFLRPQIAHELLTSKHFFGIAFISWLVLKGSFTCWSFSTLWVVSGLGLHMKKLLYPVSARSGACLQSKRSVCGGSRFWDH